MNPSPSAKRGGSTLAWRSGSDNLLIASIALAQRAPVVTRNTKHFQQVSGLRVENWAD